jgi:protein-L-isoaspartate(D-aspartate) O-methyltransferase
MGVLTVAATDWSCIKGMPDSHKTSEDRYAQTRQRMVRDQIERRGVRDPEVLRAMAEVPRHHFVPEGLQDKAYEDRPLLIGEGQTISQPYIVAYMTEMVGLEEGDRVLEIGTGSGYQAAILASIASEVFSIEILPDLASRATRRLRDLGYRNVTVRSGDGFRGWLEEAPFDAIVVTAAPKSVPRPLLEQLKVGGRLVAPVGSLEQQLVRWTRTPDGFDREPLLPVRFVPMTGEAQRSD